MALNKIELKLGKKVITLTPNQFEELKQDMRYLDRGHYYYWNHSPWYQPWDRTTSLTGIRTLLTGTTNIADVCANISTAEAEVSDPPAFSGTILSAA